MICDIPLTGRNPTATRKSQSKDAYEAESYFGYDPSRCGPPDRCIEVSSGLEVSKYRSMSNSLIHSFYADRVGLSLGKPEEKCRGRITLVPGSNSMTRLVEYFAVHSASATCRKRFLINHISLSSIHGNSNPTVDYQSGCKFADIFKWIPSLRPYKVSQGGVILPAACLHCRYQLERRRNG